MWLTQAMKKKSEEEAEALLKRAQELAKSQAEEAAAAAKMQAEEKAKETIRYLQTQDITSLYASPHDCTYCVHAHEIVDM